MADVCLKNVYKSFGDKKNLKKVLSDINLDIKDKSFCVLLGPSGCGKSTLLRIIAGLEGIDSGEIYIDNKLVNNVQAKDRNIAFVFQSYALYPHMNVFDNMAFPLKVKGLDKKTIEKKVFEASKILGLDDLLKRKPKELSGGQRQRVALGRAIVRDAKVFLMDEPLSNLDAKLRANMRVELKKLHKKLNTTFIYVTHDQTEALTMGDEIVILNEGKIFQKGSPDEIFSNPKNTFVASFSGVYPMNLIEVDIVENKILIDDFSFEIPDLKKEKLKDKNKIILGIRPEKIRPFKEKDSDIKGVFEVEFIENTGVIQIVHFKIGNNTLKAVINGKIANEKFETFYFDKNDLMFFDFDKKTLIE